MDGEVDPSWPGGQSEVEVEDCDGRFIVSLGRQKHATPKIRKKTHAKAQSNQEVRRGGRSRCNVNQLITPAVVEDREYRKPRSRKGGRTLFPSTPAAKTNAPIEQANCLEAFDYGADETNEASVTLSRRTPARRESQISGKRGAEHLGDQTEAQCSKKKSRSKKRRLYSQPFGVIEPASSVSGSQSGANPLMTLGLRTKPPDTASRGHESVYDALLEHSEKRSNRTGHSGTRANKVPCGRKSASRAQSNSAALPSPVAARSSPRPPQRRAAAAAVSHLRDSPSDNDTEGSTSNEPLEHNYHENGSPHPARDGTETVGGSPVVARGSLEETGGSPVAAGDSPEAAVDRGNTEIFYMTTVVRSDEDYSDDGVFEERTNPPAQERSLDADGCTTSDTTATERDSIWPTSDPDWEPGPSAVSSSSPGIQKTVQQTRDRRCHSPTVDTETDSDQSASPRSPGDRRSGQQDRRSGQRSSHRSSGRVTDMSTGGQSWIGSGGETFKVRRRLDRVACYSHARQPSPDRTLRRYSYLTGDRPKRRSTSAQQGRRSRSRSGSRGRGGRGDYSLGSSVGQSGRPSPSSRPSPRRAARPFFSVDPPENESTSAVDVSPNANGTSVRAGANGVRTSVDETSPSDSVSCHVLVMEQDPCWYRLPRREIGPNVSSESSATRRQQARSLPQHRRRKNTPWTYGPDGRDCEWADRQPGAECPWRLNLVPKTLGSDIRGRVAQPSSGATRLGIGAARPDSGAALPSSGADQPDRGAARSGSGGARLSSGVACPASGAASRTAHRPAAYRTSQSTPLESVEAPSRSRRQLDAGESDQATTEPEGRPVLPEIHQDASAPEWDPMEAAPAAEMGDRDTDRPVPPDPHPASAAPRLASSEHRRDSSTSQFVPHIQCDPTGPGTVSSGSQPILSDPHPAPPGSRPASSRPPSTRHVPSDPPHSVPPDPKPIPLQPQTTLPDLYASPPTPETFIPDPHPPPFDPTLLELHHPPGTRIGSELARLVARWRQLARLEERAFAALRTAQLRQKKLMNIQMRVNVARLQKGKLVRILTECVVLEGLAGAA